LFAFSGFGVRNAESDKIVVKIRVPKNRDIKMAGDQDIRIPGDKSDQDTYFSLCGNSKKISVREWQLLRFQISNFGLQIVEENMRRWWGDLGSKK
jgi:hypothetical protein